MDARWGTPSARVTDAVTHHNKLTASSLRGSIALVIGLLIAVSIPLHAQEDVEPEPAVMARLAPNSLLLDLALAGDAVVAVGERGHILVSTDVGKTWQQRPCPTRTMLTGVFFIDSEIGWAVGHDSAIVKTVDGGSNWALVNWAPEDEAPLFDVWFSDPDNGVAIGAYGTHLVTADGGETWNFEPIGDLDWHLHKIRPAGGDRLYMAGEAGTIFRSDDGGLSWIELPSPYEGSFFGVLPLDEDTVLLFGLRGHLFRSEDAGESWQELETGTVAMLTDGLLLGDGTIVIAGLGGTVLVSQDGGLSFRLYAQEDRRGISAIIDAGDGTLIMAGEFGVRATALSDLMSGSE